MRDGLPTGTAKERGFVFPVKDNFEGLKRIRECAKQLKLKNTDWAIGTDNAFSELQKTDILRSEGKYDMRFSEMGIKTRQQLINFNWSVVKSSPNFVTMEDPGSESDPEAHRLMTAKYGNRVQIVIDEFQKAARGQRCLALIYLQRDAAEIGHHSYHRAADLIGNHFGGAG